MSDVVVDQSVLYSIGSRACSLAMRSVAETKDNFILVCIGLLEALDRLQERLHLPTSLVKEMRRKLSKMVDRSLVRPMSSPSMQKLQHTKALGTTIADSDVWTTANPEEVKGFIQWILAVTKALMQLAMSASMGICRRIFILIMNLPGVPTTCSLFYRIYQMVEDLFTITSDDAAARENVRAVSNDPHHASIQMENYIGDPSLTAVVLEYREKDIVVPWNINRRIQKVMHFQIPLRSFEATVRLPPEGGNTEQLQHPTISTAEVTKTAPSYLSSTSPRSIPVSPMARKRVQMVFANLSDDVLYQARDRLRQERAATLTGERDLKIPRFNAHDCNEEIYLSCGRHSATKVGAGMYRSVRGSHPIETNRYVYFEMSLSEPHASIRQHHDAKPMDGGIQKPGPVETTDASSELSVCIGLSTRMMPLNTLVGTSRYSIGFYSSGHILIGSQRCNYVSVNFRYGINSTVGVLVHVDEEPNGPSSAMKAIVRFSVDGVAVRDSLDRVVVLSFPIQRETSELYPTLTLHSQDVQVLGRFSAPDIVAFNQKDFALPDPDEQVWCIDGLLLQ